MEETSLDNDHISLEALEALEATYYSVHGIWATKVCLHCKGVVPQCFLASVLVEGNSPSDGQMESIFDLLEI